MGNSIKIKKPQQQKHIKLMLWGKSGCGKTLTALQFPKPLLLDTEGGAKFYESRYQFDTVEASTMAEVQGVAEYLQKCQHSYKTVIMDSGTHLWQNCIDEVMKAKKKKPGTQPQMHEWGQIKPSWRHMLKKFALLDMHIIMTCQAKDVMEYDGSDWKKTGETFNCEKKTDYFFDAIVYCHNNQGRFTGYPYMKNRCGLPTEFKLGYGEFEKVLIPQTEEPKQKQQKQQKETA